ncbi:Polysaccharide pyruvyl transferase [Megamonas hypermegale]|uniref:Polysaccharide pyruvyl transferase n=1 Tax=Megamonas hypermegale TaxID=158847 RepID=A0A239T7E8_9FIRM|nr:polysaccharide pyruvyl transferase family protein [Megamonas hypermegale]SNU93429.1 Polysaccharide pyruvyl transferase [Megamonas hypermegale]
MNNIGIITFHFAYNFGSSLQAYALKFLLKNKGYNVKIINFIYERDFEQYKLFRVASYLKRPKSFIVDVLFYNKNKMRKNNFELFAKRYFDLGQKKYFNYKDMKELNDKFDTFICGSDQIWNLDCTQGVEPAYFLKFANKDKLKIAYAPSLAHVKFARNYNADLKEAIKDLDYISVREESTLPLIQPLTEKKVNVVLDPTLLLDKKDYELIINQYKNESEYIFVYMLEYSAELVKYCNEFSNKKRIKVIYISNNKISGIKGKNAFGIGPDKFLKYIKEAKYIITNSFHATVFSIIFNKKFVTFTTKRSSSRMVDLLDKLGISERIYNEKFNIDKDIDYDIVQKNLIDMRKSSLEYLRKALKRE